MCVYAINIHDTDGLHSTSKTEFNFVRDVCIYTYMCVRVRACMCMCVGKAYVRGEIEVPTIAIAERVRDRSLGADSPRKRYPREH